MDTIYYYYYQFYKEILTEKFPHETTVFVLGFSEGFFLNVIVDVLSIVCFKVSLGMNFLLCIAIIVWGINYFYFDRSGKADRIVKDKPKFFGNHRLSQIISAIFFITTASSLFWGPVLTKYLHDIYCS